MDRSIQQFCKLNCRNDRLIEAMAWASRYAVSILSFVLVPLVADAEWPTYRHDNARSGHLSLIHI